MLTRKLLIAIFAAALVVALAALPTGSASAEQRTLLVTLVGGRQVTVSVDVPPGTPVSQIQLPGIAPGTVVSVADITAPAPAPAPPVTTPAPAPDPVQTQPTDTAPAAPPATQTAPGPPQATPTTPATTPTTPETTPTTTTPGGDPARGPKAKADGTDPQQQAQRTTGAGTIDLQAQDEASRGGRHDKKARTRSSGGAPTPANPTYTLAVPGPAPIGVPNFFIDKFRIPPFLLSIYQAAGIEYGIRWEVLAAINEIETDYGRNLNVSTAGAVGWMQFLPSTWRRYGVDANKDGRRDPYNPVDAVFGAARYLRAAGAGDDLRRAIFAYNHADWYVDSVLLRARLLGGLPADFVGSLTGLTQGRFPVHARATYADDISERDAKRRIARGQNAAIPVEANADRRSIDIYAKAGSPVIAVQDGRIVNIGTSKRLGRFIQLRDAYGNTYTYGNLKKLATEYPVPKPKKVSRAQVARELKLPGPDPKPTEPASAGRQAAAPAKDRATANRPTHTRSTSAPSAARLTKERLFANPSRPNAFARGGRKQILDAGGSVGGLTTFRSYFSGVYGLKRKDVVLRRLKVGSRVIAGTILGRIGRTNRRQAPHTMFEIRPAGRGAPRIDPKPILDGWKLLESTAIYRAEGKNPLFGPDAKTPSVGQVLLMSKDALARQVLADPNVDLYSCGRRDIEGGQIDRRVLATLEFLSASGMRPTVTSMRCGHSYLTASGNVSEHSSGDAVDIAAINGIPILGHQGPGSITDLAVRRLLTLQGAMKPHQIITLMTYPGTDNTLALPDHDDHIHVGFQPLTGQTGRQFESVLKPGQWDKLIDRLKTLDNPTVALKPSKYALPAGTPDRASAAHQSE